MQVIERSWGHYEVRGEFDEVYGRRAPECVVLECGCRARWILDDLASIRHVEELGILDCGVCGERFVLTLTEGGRSH